MTHRDGYAEERKAYEAIKLAVQRVEDGEDSFGGAFAAIEAILWEVLYPEPTP